MPPPGGSTGSTPTASTSTAATSRLSRWRPPTTLNTRDQPPAESHIRKSPDIPGRFTEWYGGTNGKGLGVGDAGGGLCRGSGFRGCVSDDRRHCLVGVGHPRGGNSGRDSQWRVGQE